MKNKLLILLITSLAFVLSANAEPDFLSDYTGEAYFRSPDANPVFQDPVEKKSTSEGTIPPVKKLRLKIQEARKERLLKNTQFAPTLKQEPYRGEVETSKYASKEIEEDFDDMTSQDFDNGESDTENKKQKKGLFGAKYRTAEPAEGEGIILDCEQVDYDTENYLIIAKGNVSVEFVKQDTVVKSDTITFDRINNTIKAEGNVRILKHGYETKGDYIFVDLNEENALIENPVTGSESIEIKAQKGYVYGDKIIQENGRIDVKESYPIRLRPNKKVERVTQMYAPKNETLTSDIENGIIKFRADNISIKQKGDLEVISIKKGRLSKGNRTVFKIPAIKIYTNKNHDYAESNFMEIGNYRGLGTYVGAGFVFELPKGSVLKAMPILQSKSGIGFGAMGRFSSGTNQTVAAYGTASSKIFVYGRQELDDNLFMQYAMNSYMDEWFLGRRRPKYGASLVYNRNYSAKDFLLPGKVSSFGHRIEAGYFQDLDFDASFEKIKGGGNIGTTRFRYMAMARQNVFLRQNPEKLRMFAIDLTSQLSAAVYGTGDTQVIGRLGPTVRWQYKRWMQELGYFFNAYEDNSPLKRYDAFRYGSQSLAIREYLRICRWLTVSWFGNINTTNDSINGKRLQENAFFLTFGPDDFKFHLGYDWVRQTLRAYVEVMMDAKGAEIEYNKLEIKQDKKAKKEEKIVESKPNDSLAPVRPRVLQRAVVEDVRVMEDVL